MTPPPFDEFRRLHQGPGLLLLANCWDAGSARLIESLGAPALATTSAGLAWSIGYPDGDTVPMRDLVAAVAAIARVTRVPLTVDFEAGYSSNPGDVADRVAALADAGAVGVNLEDGGDPPSLLAEKIARIKAKRGDVFVNARTDVYLRGLAPEGERVEPTLERARLYREAGADCLFVPKVTAPEEIRAIADAAGLPLNVLAWPGLPAPGELAALGVRRLSAGSAIAQRAYGAAARNAVMFLADGCLEDAGVKAYGEMNALFAGGK